MKKVLASVLLAALAFVACQKEFSIENGQIGNLTGAWEFKDSANLLYAGNSTQYFIDDTSNPASAIMDYTGTTANLNATISIQVFFPTGTAATGSYQSALGQVNFLYIFSNTGRTFEANGLSGPFSTENITVNITQISDTSVTGTFSGVALDSANRLVPIKEGKFSYRTRSVIVPVPPVSVGTLGSATDTCTGAVVSGIYKKSTALNPTNIVQLSVNVATAGTYTIFSDTLKGIYFRGTGSFTTTGVQSLTLPGIGTPTDSGTVRFRVRYGTSNCTFLVKIDTAAGVVVVPPVGDYFPTTTNSNWSYDIRDSGSSTINDTTYTLSTGQTASVTGANFNIFTNDDGSGFGLDTSFYRKGSGLYYTTYDLSDFFGAGGVVSGIFLKDNVALGTTWTDSYNITYNGVPAVVTANNIILAKAVSATINTVSSTDVIKVRTTFSITSFGATTTGYILENWFARGIGLLYSKQTPVIFPLFPTQEIMIRRYTVL